MNQKAGRHQCDRCNGEGCYHCERTGYVYGCPVCMAVHNQSEAEHEIHCGACGTVYERNGDIAKLAEERPRKKAIIAPAPKRGLT